MGRRTPKRCRGACTEGCCDVCNCNICKNEKFGSISFFFSDEKITLPASATSPYTLKPNAIPLGGQGAYEENSTQRLLDVPPVECNHFWIATSFTQATVDTEFFTYTARPLLGKEFIVNIDTLSDTDGPLSVVCYVRDIMIVEKFDKEAEVSTFYRVEKVEVFSGQCEDADGNGLPLTYQGGYTKATDFNGSDVDVDERTEGLIDSPFQSAFVNFDKRKSCCNSISCNVSATVTKNVITYFGCTVFGIESQPIPQRSFKLSAGTLGGELLTGFNMDFEIACNLGPKTSGFQLDYIFLRYYAEQDPDTPIDFYFGFLLLEDGVNVRKYRTFTMPHAINKEDPLLSSCDICERFNLSDEACANEAVYEFYKVLFGSSTRITSVSVPTLIVGVRGVVEEGGIPRDECITPLDMSGLVIDYRVTDSLSEPCPCINQ